MTQSLTANTVTDDIFETFYEVFLWHYEEAFPLVTKHNNRRVVNKIRLPESLLKDLETLKELNYMRKILDDNAGCIIQYKQLKKQTSERIRMEKQNYFKNRIECSTNKARCLWRLVNELRGKSSKDPADIRQIKFKSSSLTATIDIVNAFATHYQSVVSDQINVNFGYNAPRNCTSSPHNDHSMFFKPVTRDDVILVIDSIQTKNSLGPDGVAISVVKYCKHIISEPLARAMNKSVECGNFPSSLKVACITPVHKNGDREILDNYRPIALTSPFSKIFEKLMYKQIINFLDKFNILTNCQHGFRQGRSTETGTIDFIQQINHDLDLNKCVAAVLFDLSKAFDTIDPKFISHKLHNIGLRGNINDWLVSFVTCRQYFVRINKTKSSVFHSSLGTPQGSVLGPLIFLLYVNDLPYHIEQARIFMYADDTSMVVTDDTPDGLKAKIQKVMGDFTEWCRRNRLIINLSKTVVIEFHSKLKKPDNIVINFRGTLLTAVNVAKFLGTLIDSTLSWSNHIDHVCTKLNRAYFMISSLMGHIPQESLLSVYYAQVYSVIAYNIVVWGCSNSISRVFVLQKRILRKIFGLNYIQTCRTIFSTKKILTVSSIYVLLLLLFIHKNKSKLVKNSDCHNYNTRLRDDIRMTKHRHDSFKKSPIYTGVRLYNNLPCALKEIEPLHIFKARIKSILLSKPFYTLKEINDFFTNPAQ